MCYRNRRISVFNYISIGSITLVRGCIVADETVLPNFLHFMVGLLATQMMIVSKLVIILKFEEELNGCCQN